MTITSVIKNDTQYAAAMARIDELLRLNAHEGTKGDPLFDELELISALVWMYDREREEPIPPDPVEAIRYAMDRRGLRPKDLIPYFGTFSQVSDVLNRRRGLTLRIIRNLHNGLGIPLENLIGSSAKSGADTKAS